MDSMGSEWGRRRDPLTPARRHATSWTEIERAVLLRIARKQYVRGQRLPTCEALAAELEVNKNTVSKAYRSLAKRGHLSTRAGLGTFVANRPVRLGADRGVDHVRDLLSLALQEAKLSGLGETQFYEIAEQVVENGFRHAGPRVGFIDCNRQDAAVLSRQIQEALGHPVEPLLLDEMTANPRNYLRDYAVVAVSLTHLAAVEAALGEKNANESRPQVFGMYIPIDPESLTQVARLRAGTKVGIICDLKPTLTSVEGLVGSINPAIEISSCLTREKTALQRLICTSDVLLVTPSASKCVQKDSEVPVIWLAFRNDQRSMEQLAALIRQEEQKTKARRGKPARRMTVAAR